MAIVFVSPRKKQITFLVSIATFFLFIVIIVSLIVFLSKPTVVSEDQVFKKPNIVINISVLDSDELKNLVPIDPVQYDFNYVGTGEGGKLVSGKITALSLDDATAKLTAMKFVGLKVEQELAGRDNPFGVYYQIAPIINLKKK